MLPNKLNNKMLLFIRQDKMKTWKKKHPVIHQINSFLFVTVLMIMHRDKLSLLSAVLLFIFRKKCPPYWGRGWISWSSWKNRQRTSQPNFILTRRPFRGDPSFYFNSCKVYLHTHPPLSHVLNVQAHGWEWWSDWKVSKNPVRSRSGSSWRG